MADETKEVQTVQESPTVEEEQAEETEVVEEAQPDTKVETEQEKNWKALREENERLKKQIEQKEESVIDTPSPVSTVKKSPAVEFYLSPEVQNQMQFEEFKAEQAFPELENDKLFADVVVGKYRQALDEYVDKISKGQQAQVPSVHRIAKSTKSTWEERFGSVKKQAEQEGASKAKASVGEREATFEAEGRSDRGVKAENATELSKLRFKSRHGDDLALTERLNRSGL